VNVDGGGATGSGSGAAGVGLTGTATANTVYQGAKGDCGGDGDTGDHAGGFHGGSDVGWGSGLRGRRLYVVCVCVCA